MQHQASFRSYGAAFLLAALLLFCLSACTDNAPAVSEPAGPLDLTGEALTVSDYEAKRAKNRNASRIRYLENMLKTATIVSDDSKDDEVGMDDIVEVYFEEDDEIEKYKLVTSIRGNSMENRISIESPIGMALKGHKVGDRVEVKVNDNYSYFLEIRSIDKTGSEDEEIRGF